MKFLQINNTIVDYQYGFQKIKSTLDPLTQLEYSIRDTILRDEYLVVVFLDIEKAYDMVWAHGLLQELFNIGLRGNLPIFIQNFLMNRTIQVKIANFISSKYKIENGLPQGSIISVVLFLIVINKMFANCNQTINKLFCDDGAFWYRAPNLDLAEGKIQNTLDHLTKWSKENGLKFSTQKSTYCIFTHHYKTRHLNLKLYDANLPSSFEVKYLGLTLDHRLSWDSHITTLKEKSQKRLSILRCVSRRKWGADRKTLKMLYLALIQSLINYASFLYGDINTKNRTSLQTIQNEGIRIFTGALRCTKATMLEAEAHLMPLDLRRQFLGLTYLGRAARLEISITADLFASHRNMQFHMHRHLNRNKPLSWIGHAHIILDEMGFNYGEIAKLSNKYVYNPPILNIKFTMHTSKKDQLNPHETKKAFLEMLNQYQTYIPVFTDGSVKDEKAGCAAVVKYQTHSYRLPNNTSIHTAELYAILKAIEKIKETNNTKFLICSDSYSSLQTLKTGDSNNLGHEIFNTISSTNKTIAFEWIPSHMGIQGNDAADTGAKLALSLEDITPIPIPYNEFKSKVRKHLHKKWQNWWDTINTPTPNTRTTPLYHIKPIIKDWPSANRNLREEEITLARLRLGTCLFNKKHLFKREPHPDCEFCHVPISVSHILVDCTHFNNERAPILAILRKEGLPIEVASILNENFPPDTLITYLKNIHYFSKI